MTAQGGHTQHHVVGPVHVIELHEDEDAASLTTALADERDRCNAARVMIDLSGFDGSMSVVLEGAERSGWDQDIMVRTADQAHLTLHELRELSNA